MWSRHHSQASKEKMSASHRAYQERIRQQQAPSGMTMQQFLANTPHLDIKGYIQSLMKDELNEIIRQEIKKLL